MTRLQLAGLLLLVSLVLWLPAAALPRRVWTVSHEERLGLVTGRRRLWQLVNLSIAAAAVLLVLGVVALAEPLRRAGQATLVDLSLALLFLGAPLWVVSLARRIRATSAGTNAARVLFVAWSVLVNVAVISLGIAIVLSDLVGAWPGWVAMILAVLVLLQLAITGDALPATYHLGPALIGVAVLL